MTKSKLYQIFAWEPDTKIEYWVDFSDEKLKMWAELVAIDSTIRNRKQFEKDWPGFNANEPSTEGYDEYSEGFFAAVDTVKDFAKSSNLELYVNT